MSLEIAQVQNRSSKLVQIIDDTVQILVDDFDLMQDDQYEEPNEINAEEIIYDVIKVLEDCSDPEVALEMIVPVTGSLQKYIINLSEHSNVFLIQLFLHLLQTCLTGIKGEFTLPKSIVKHITEVVVTKLPKDSTLLVEQAFLLGALVQHCSPEDLFQMDFLCSDFIQPLLNEDQSDDVMEALTGCITDISSTFKIEFSSQTQVIQALIDRLSQNIPDKQTESICNAIGDITLSGGLEQTQLIKLIKSIQQKLYRKDMSRSNIMALVQMHTCLFNSLNEMDLELINSLVPYVRDLIEFVILSIQMDDQSTKVLLHLNNKTQQNSLKDQLSLLLDIAVLYGKSDAFLDLQGLIWNGRTRPHFKSLKNQLELENDYKPLLYFDNVLQRIFQVNFNSL